MQWYIGCSGFYYKEWKEVFYPKGLAQKNWFEFYCQHFNTIEINATFYKMPTQQSFEKWYHKSAPDFLFTVKVPRLITHYKQLNDCQTLLNDFYLAVETGLREKLACVLFQFPPKFSFSKERLNKITSALNPNFSNVVEFRHSSWWNEEVYDHLAQKNIIFCGQSYPSALPDELIKNNDTIYYRFHGKPDLYKSEYPFKEILNFAAQMPSKTKKCLIYFNNTWGTGALKNAKQLQGLVK